MSGLLDGLISWSISNRFVVLLLGIALIIAGVVTATKATTDVLPDFTPPRVVVQTEAPGMGTSDVEELVTRPLERVLLGTPDADSVRSVSSSGLSVVTLTFADGVDLYRARQAVTERLQLVQGQLPTSVKDPKLSPIQAPIGALLKFCITSSAKDQEQAAKDLRAFADWTLRPRLLAIPGVAQVTNHGGDVERVEVRPDPSKMRQRAVSIEDITSAIQGSQAIFGAGFVELGDNRFDIQNNSRLSLRDAAGILEETSVKLQENALPVRLGDVAEVVSAYEPRVGVALFDGKPAVYVQVVKLPWADTLEATAKVESALHELERDLPEGAKLEPPVFRQASFVQTSIFTVGRAMGIGSILVIFVLLAFLRSGRLAFISLTAIPLSLLTALSVLIYAGASINGMTLGGLAIAVGEVVDDAIVDVENVWRRLRENALRESPRPALEVIREASKEIRGSVVYATIIVGLVLIPVLTLGGIAGRIFSPLGYAYVLAIGSSLLVALTITPALCAWLLPKIATKEARPTRLALWLLNRYRSLIRRVASHPRWLFLLIGLLAAGAIAALPFLGGRFLPEFHEGSLIAHVHAVPGTSLAESARLAALIDTQARPSVASHISSRAGRAELDEDAAPVNRLEMDFVLNEDDDREWDEIVVDVATRIGKVTGLGFAVEGFLGERVHEILSGDTAPIVVKVIGPDLEQLRALTADVAQVMSNVPGLGTIRVEPQIDVTQIQLRPDRAACNQYKVRPIDLADAVVAWRQGQGVSQILEPDGRVIDIVLAGPPELQSLSALKNIPIQTPGAGVLPLSVFASIEQAPSPALINHEGGERRISIGADAPGAGLSTAVEVMEKALAEKVQLPHGYRLEVGGEAVARSQAASRLLLIGSLVLIGIFALLSMAFQSPKDAVIVLLNLPLGLIGGVIASFFNPEGLSVAGFVGFVTLFGIISRNGIMLVSHKLHLDTNHPELDPVERVFRAAEERLLPILMTAATAGLGLLPLVLSFESAGSELESPMALIVLAGLVTSTALNMLVLPTVYVWMAKRKIRREEGTKP